MAIQKAKITMVKSRTSELPIHGYLEDTTFDSPLYYYGSDKDKIQEIIHANESLGESIHPAFPYIKAEVLWAVREEMCMTIEDFLARRSRMLFLDAAAAVEASGTVATLMASLLHKDNSWIREQTEEFTLLANQYLPHLNTHP